MKNILIIAACLFQLNSIAKHRCLNLQKALKDKYVQVNFTSAGGYQGFCMNMRIKNLSADTLFVLLEAGRRLNSIDDKNQDILIVKEELFVLSAGMEKNLKIKGYCCQASKRCPSERSRYDANTLADSNLVRIARFINSNPMNEETEQDLVWAISDRRSLANIDGNNDSLTQILRGMVAGITGEKLPWYTLVSVKHVYPGGVILISPVKLRGQLIYSNEKENYATLFVINEKGWPVCGIKSEWIKATTQAVYQLELPIKGLTKGKYKVELRTPEKQLASQEFEI